MSASPEDCIPIITKPKYLSVQARRKDFKLSARQIDFDAPSLLSHVYHNVNPAEGDALHLDMHPNLFAIIQDYLSGYTILPLAPDCIPSSMTIETALVNLAKEANNLQLGGLMTLIKQHRPPANELLYLLASKHHYQRILSTEAAVSQSRQDFIDDEWLYSTIFTAKDLRADAFIYEQIVPAEASGGESSPASLIRAGKRERILVYGCRLPSDFEALLFAAGSQSLKALQWRYTENSNVELNGKQVPLQEWENFQCEYWAQMRAGKYSPEEITLPQIEEAWRHQFESKTKYVKDLLCINSLSYAAVARQVVFSVQVVVCTGSDSGMPIPAATHVAWIHSIKLETAPYIASRTQVFRDHALHTA